ncbi:fibrinogen-like protein 1-like protein [Argopecten irradians]|uniref:fibrinogen-like protein 1-like protein n=1 Tax=Argopecten irradians TaxID=31199 RepID=UPI0037235D7A
MITDGEDYTKPGTLLQYRCYDGLLKFHGGTITCMTSGHWSDFGSPLGCSIYGDSTCMNDNDCADVTMSKCRDGLCVCMENHMRYDKTKNACVTGCESFSGSAEQEYSVKPNGIDTLKVWCKQGWTVIHNRQSGNVNFEAKTWSDYKYGFGDILGDYWIGLDKLHLLTQTGATVRLHMVFDTMENMTLTHYDFKVGKESTNYTMHVSSNFDSSLDMSPSFSGLYSSSGATFYTTDRESYWACASSYGAWWYSIHFVTYNCWVNIRGMNGEFDSMLIRYLESSQSNIINFNVETVNIAIRLF